MNSVRNYDLKYRPVTIILQILNSDEIYLKIIQTFHITILFNNNRVPIVRHIRHKWNFSRNLFENNISLSSNRTKESLVSFYSTLNYWNYFEYQSVLSICRNKCSYVAFKLLSLSRFFNDNQTMKDNLNWKVRSIRTLLYWDFSLIQYTFL